MAQKAIEMILMRQLAGSLAMPIFLVDAEGTLLFFNEPAEQLLGLRFEETGEMPAKEWAKLWDPTENGGRRLPPARLPLMIAVAERRPVHGAFALRGPDGTRRHVQATAFPLIRPNQVVLGAVVLFWEAAPAADSRATRRRTRRASRRAAAPRRRRRGR